jgi:hypothetical protein
VNETEIACGCLVVSGCQSARAFEFIEAPLDAVSQGIGDAIYLDGCFAIDLARDDRRSTTAGNPIANVITVISAIGQKDLCCRKVFIDQCVKTLVIADFAAGYLRPDRQSVSVGNEVDLGREATL